MNIPLKKASTTFLRVTLVIMGLVALGFCCITVPVVWRDANIFRPILIGMCVTALPYLFALGETAKLLRLIDTNAAFSEMSVKILGNIRYCCVLVAVLYAAGLPYFYHIADIDDAPGAMVGPLIIILASATIAVFAAVLQKLLQNAIDIKKENDLVV